MKYCKQILCGFIVILFLSGCSFNPFVTNNHTTGDPIGAVVGAGIGAGTMGLLGGSKPAMVAAGIGGGMLGYYVTTLRYDAGGVIDFGGQVYQVGRFVGIDMPSDKLFEPNTATLLPCAYRILDSAADILKRYPENNILISANTSGFSSDRREQKLSRERAKVVSAYLWDHDVTRLSNTDSLDARSLKYVGYNHYFPISQDYTEAGIRRNSHIQITSYPSEKSLRRYRHTGNVGALDDSDAVQSECEEMNSEGKCFKKA